MYYILSTSGESNDTRRRIINAVNAAVGNEMSEAKMEIINKFGRITFPVRWVSYVDKAQVNSTGVTVDISLAPEQAKAAIIAALRKAKDEAQGKTKPTPPPPNPTQEPEPTVVHTDPVVWFRTEDDNLFHHESHTAVAGTAAEFFAVRADAVAAGLTADGVCGA